VFPTSDSQTNIASVLSYDGASESQPKSFAFNEHARSDIPPSQAVTNENQSTGNAQKGAVQQADHHPPTESDALYDLPAIPLYFPTSYSLVKPYVHGFEPNGLDLFLLDEITIDNGWQPKPANSES
jgi:hypothetical protein